MTKDMNTEPSEDIKPEKKPFWTEKKIEAVVAVFLGITTLVSAWSSWIGSLHSGIQAINFTKSNNIASEGTAEYNLGMQLYLSDYMTWNTMKDYYVDLELAKNEGDQTKQKLIEEKLESFVKESASDLLVEGLEWMEKNNEDSPFKMPGLSEKYFESAQGKVDESQELLEEGQRDNTKGDSYNLASVIFSLVLFLLGIVGLFKNLPNRVALMMIAIGILILGIIYMCTIPLPTGFNPMNFFNIK